MEAGGCSGASKSHQLKHIHVSYLLWWTYYVNLCPPVYFPAFKLNRARKVILEIKSDVNQLHERQNDQSNRDLIAWLSPVNYHTQQDDFLRRRQAGTGKWLLNSDKFQTWLKGSKQTLFCHGIPGAGKTMMSSIVIGHLETEFKSQANIGIAYLYCSYRQQHQQKTEDLLLSLLQQLAQQQSFIPADVRNFMSVTKANRLALHFTRL